MAQAIRRCIADMDKLPPAEIRDPYPKVLELARRFKTLAVENQSAPAKTDGRQISVRVDRNIDHRLRPDPGI
jgi:hypothetical protein